MRKALAKPTFPFPQISKYLLSRALMLSSSIYKSVIPSSAKKIIIITCPGLNGPDRMLCLFKSKYLQGRVSKVELLNGSSVFFLNSDIIPDEIILPPHSMIRISVLMRLVIVTNVGLIIVSCGLEFGEKQATPPPSNQENKVPI